MEPAKTTDSYFIDPHHPLIPGRIFRSTVMGMHACMSLHMCMMSTLTTSTVPKYNTGLYCIKPIKLTTLVWTGISSKGTAENFQPCEECDQAQFIMCGRPAEGEEGWFEGPVDKITLYPFSPPYNTSFSSTLTNLPVFCASCFLVVLTKPEDTGWPLLFFHGLCSTAIIYSGWRVFS